MSGIGPMTHGSYEIGPKYEQLPALANAPTIQRYFKDHGYYTLSGGKVLHHNFGGRLSGDIDRSLGRARSPRPKKPMSRPASWSGGKVLQVVANNPFQSTNAINISHNSGGAVGPSDLGADVKLTITPSAATSKILYFAQLSSVGGANSGATIQINTILYRHISGGSATATGASCGTYVENNTYTPHMIVHLDSPNTTNAIEYKLYGSGNYATGGQYAWQRTTGSTQIVALEIGA